LIRSELDAIAKTQDLSESERHCNRVAQHEIARQVLPEIATWNRTDWKSPITPNDPFSWRHV
jgi:hypothetical protein